MSDAVEAPVTEEPAPPAEPAQPEPPPDPEAAELAELEQNAVALPDGDGIGKYVPLSAVTKPREEAKQFRTENKTLKAQLEAAQAAAAAAQPYVDAAKAILSQPQAQPQEPQGPSAEERAELEEIARDLDFYKQAHEGGGLDRAQAMLHQATQFKDPITQESPDPQVLRELFNKVWSQPGGSATLTNPEAVAFIASHALNLTRWRKGPQAPSVPRTPAPDGPPVFVEASGGGAQVPSLSSMERKAAKDLGMTESEYLKAAASRPRG